MAIALGILGFIILADVLTFIMQCVGCASNLTYYICRPFWGMFGDSISMFMGLLIRLAETGLTVFCIDSLIRHLL